MNKSLAIDGGVPIRKEPIPIHRPVIEKDDLESVTEAIKSTFISGDGPRCREFEKALARYLDTKYVFFTNSCTAALDLAFRVMEFDPGSEVIVPNFTYTSTALAPILNNLKVVLVDVRPYNGNINPAKIEEAITDRTVAICPVDYAGNPAEMDQINAIAKKHRLLVVHDTAQSIGAELSGLKTGTLADISCFSFHGTKNITTGEGGALVTDSINIANKVLIARDKGTDKHAFISDPKKKGFYEYVATGHSYVQSDLLGALGITQLRKLDRILKRRREIADFYNSHFRSLEKIRIPGITQNALPNWHIYYLLVPPGKKDWILEALKAEGIACNIHYSPLHMNSFYRSLGAGRDLEDSVRFYRSLIRIPIYPDLNDRDVEDIVKAVTKVCGEL